MGENVEEPFYASSYIRSRVHKKGFLLEPWKIGCDAAILIKKKKIGESEIIDQPKEH